MNEMTSSYLMMALDCDAARREAIPDDVMKATNAACDELSRHTEALGLADFTELQRVVARAIIAERERCARLADSRMRDGMPRWDDGPDIASAIRKGEA